MISEKKMMKSCSVFHKVQKKKFEKFNCFLFDFLRSTFGGIKIMSTVVEREHTPDITVNICFAYQLTAFYMVEVSLNSISYSYILENHLFRDFARLLF